MPSYIRKMRKKRSRKDLKNLYYGFEELTFDRA